jgi:ATP-dependent Clp protease ATP-binding subunit ClpA
LTPEDARAIASQYLSTIGAILAKAHKTFEIDDEALDAIVRLGHSPAYGARFLKRIIDERIKLPITTNWHEPHFHVRVDDGKVVVDPTRAASAAQAIAYPCGEVA